MTLGRRTSMGAARLLSAVRSARRLALSACGHWRGRFLSGGGRRRAALTAPLPVAPRRHSSWCQLSRAAALTAGWHSAAALPRRRLALSAHARRLVLSACCRLRGCFLSGGSRRRTALKAPLPAALTAPLPAAQRWRPWRRLCRAVALTAAWRSAAALPWRRLALLARCVVLGIARSLRVVVCAVTFSIGAVDVARRSRRRCLVRHAGTPRAGLVVSHRFRRRDARPPLFRRGGSPSQRGA